MDEFADDAANTIVYSYIFRLSGQTEENGGENGTATEEGGRAGSAAPTRVSRPKSVSSSHHTADSASQPATTPTIPARSTESSPPARREGETEAARLMRELIRNGNHPEVSIGCP